MANEQGTITRAWLEMQARALDSAMWTLSKNLEELRVQQAQAQIKLAELNGSKRTYEWMLGMLEQGRLGLMTEDSHGE